MVVAHGEQISLLVGDDELEMTDHQISHTLQQITYFKRLMDHELITAVASKRTLASE